MVKIPEGEFQSEKIKVDLDSIRSGIDDGKIVEVFPTEVDLKIGQELRFFVDSRAQEKRFIKLFKGSNVEAESEITNVRQLSMVKIYN